MGGRPRDSVVLLDRDVAEELLDLVKDEPGHADEDRLDDALEAITTANGRLAQAEQRLVAQGKAVAFSLEPVEVEAVITLVEDDVETDKRTLRSVARTLKSKLRAAAKKARRR